LAAAAQRSLGNYIVMAQPFEDARSTFVLELDRRARTSRSNFVLELRARTSCSNFVLVWRWGVCIL
jgi:hypothetical protein